MSWFSGELRDLPPRLIIFSVLTVAVTIWIFALAGPRITHIGKTLCKRGGDDGPIEVCSWSFANLTGAWDFFKDDDMWPIHHYISPCLLGLFFCSYVFKTFENTSPYPFKEYKQRKPWPLRMIHPYLFYFLMVAGLGALWESWEALMALSGLGYFLERAGDTNVGDMGLNYFGSIFTCVVFYLFLGRPVSYLFPYRKLWEKIERIVWILIVLIPVDYMGVIDIVIDNNHIVHAGYWIYPLAKLTTLEWARWSDLRIARREKWRVLTQSEVNLFIDYVELFIICTWFPSFGLQYSTYLAILIGQVFFVFMLFFYKFVAKKAKHSQRVRTIMKNKK